MISPLVRQSFLLSSKTVFMFSIHTASTGPSNTYHFLSLVVLELPKRIMDDKMPSVLKTENRKVNRPANPKQWQNTEQKCTLFPPLAVARNMVVSCCRSLELVEGENAMSVCSQRYDIRGAQNIFPLTQYLGYYRPVSCLAPTLFARVKALAAYSMFSIRYKYLSRNFHYSPFMC